MKNLSFLVLVVFGAFLFYGCAAEKTEDTAAPGESGMMGAILPKESAAPVSSKPSVPEAPARQSLR